MGWMGCLLLRRWQTSTGPLRDGKGVGRGRAETCEDLGRSTWGSLLPDVSWPVSVFSLFFLRLEEVRKGWKGLLDLLGIILMILGGFLMPSFFMGRLVWRVFLLFFPFPRGGSSWEV